MPSGRIILKSISASKKLAKLKSDGARLLYTWLLTHLDVNGCYSGDALVVQRKVFTRLRHRVGTINDYLTDMARADLIIIYEVNGDTFLYVPDFVAKQPSINPEREAKPTIPLPTQEQLKSKSGVTPFKVKQSKVKQILDGKEKRTPFRDMMNKFIVYWDKYKDGRYMITYGKDGKIAKELWKECLRVRPQQPFSYYEDKLKLLFEQFDIQTFGAVKWYWNRVVPKKSKKNDKIIRYD